MYKVAYLTKNRMVKVVDVKLTRVVGFSHTVEIEESFFFLGVLELNTSNVYFPTNGYTDFELFISSFSEFIPVIQDNHFSEKERLLNFNPVDLFLVKSSEVSDSSVKQSVVEPILEDEPILQDEPILEEEPVLEEELQNPHLINFRNTFAPFVNHKVAISSPSGTRTIESDSLGNIDFGLLMVDDTIEYKFQIESYFPITMILSEAKLQGTLTFLTF